MRTILCTSLLAFASCQSPPVAQRPEAPPRVVVATPNTAPIMQPTGGDNPATQRFLQQEIDRQTQQPVAPPQQYQPQFQPQPQQSQPIELQPVQQPVDLQPAQPQRAQWESVQQQPVQPQSVPMQSLQPQRVQGQTDEAQTNQWLQQQIDERNAQNPERAPEPVYQVIERDRPVYVERPYCVDRPVYYYRVPCRDYVGVGYDCYGEPIYGYNYYDGRYRGTTFPVNTAIGAGVGAIIGNQYHHQTGRGVAIGAGVGLLMDLFGRR